MSISWLSGWGGGGLENKAIREGEGGERGRGNFIHITRGLLCSLGGWWVGRWWAEGQERELCQVMNGEGWGWGGGSQMRIVKD